MLGSDIVTVTSYQGKTLVEDRYVTWAAYPLTEGAGPFPNLDIQNDWTITCLTSTSTSLTAVVHRLLKTGDNQDRPFTTGLLPVVIAFGGYGLVSYHGANRDSSFVDFMAPHVSTSSIPADADGLFNYPFAAPI